MKTQGPERTLLCRCGNKFKTRHSHKFYCSPECQIIFSYGDMWEKVKTDYKFRCRQLCAMAKNRSKVGNLPFNLTKEYLRELWEEQDGRCTISGRKFELGRPAENETVKANAPSLDRVEPKLGYVKGNVRFVCYQVNTSLNEYGLEAFVSLCKDVIKFQNGGIV